MWNPSRYINTKTFINLTLINLMLLTMYLHFNHFTSDHHRLGTEIILPDLKKYLIKTPECLIVDSDPFAKVSMSFVKKLEKVVCNVNEPLIQSNQTSIWIDQTVSKNMGLSNFIKCCYRSLRRGYPKEATDGAIVDNIVVFGEKCISFHGSANIYDEFVEVTCKKIKKIVYKDYHAFMVPKRSKEVVRRKSKTEKPSVLIIGIDSISRLNLYRQMPKTLRLVKELGAIELLGLNKVGDNTFPNIMPLFTGNSVEELKNTCWRNKEDYFDNCTYIWDAFSAKNYLTAFGEDTCWMGLFLYLTSGFRTQPTDYYTQPYMRQNEGEIGHEKRGNAKLCSGSRLALDVLLDYSEKFVLNMTKEDLPFWAHFWGTSLSHDYFNVPPNADDTYEMLFKSFHDNRVLEKTVVIFMSDHGMRWGDFRETHQGYLEERLPFAFLMIPKWIQKKYPSVMENLQINTRRLTSHFDLHATLLDILNIDNLVNNIITTDSLKGMSLFRQIPLERTCETAGIPEHFCACHLNQEISTTDFKVKVSAENIVRHLNGLMKGNFDKCAPLTLHKVVSARIGELDESDKELLIVLTTMPGGAMFEATTVYNFQTNLAEVRGFVSRINSYGNDSYCVNDDKLKLLKLYCYCNSFLL